MRVRNQPVILTQHIKALQPHGPSCLQVMLSDACVQRPRSPGPPSTLPWAGQDSLPGLLTSYKVGKHQRLSLTGPGGQHPVPSSHSSPQVSPFSTGQPGVTPRNCQSRHGLHYVENQLQGTTWGPGLASAGVWNGITRTLPISCSAPATRSLHIGGSRLPGALMDLFPQPGDRFLPQKSPGLAPHLHFALFRSLLRKKAFSHHVTEQSSLMVSVFTLLDFAP